MDSIVSVARYIVYRYSEITHERIDEMKLHKLLYFTQRESFAVIGRAAFEGDFEGWRYGPVSPEVHRAFAFMDNRYDDTVADEESITDDVRYIVNNVILGYGSYASWKLSEMSHKEISWKNSRQGLRPQDNGTVVLKLSDIEEDSKKVRPYDHTWDMYYDEFEDVEEGLCR